MAYLYLTLAIIAEVVATSTLKSTEEFSRLVPSVVVVIGYCTAIWFMTLALRQFPIGITYAVWGGLGIVLVAIVGAVAYREVPDTAALLGMALIIAGVVVINVFSKTVAH